VNEKIEPSIPQRLIASVAADDCEATKDIMYPCENYSTILAKV